MWQRRPLNYIHVTLILHMLGFECDVTCIHVYCDEFIIEGFFLSQLLYYWHKQKRRLQVLPFIALYNHIKVIPYTFRGVLHPSDVACPV